MIILVFCNVLKIAKVRPLVGQKGPYNPTGFEIVNKRTMNLFKGSEDFGFSNFIWLD